jgi:succinate dehydrogenase flavin-adding protein (antitoxin of CptAB toxin-antitoxin module)
MKIHVVCQTCGKTLSVVEKEQVSQEDLDMYRQMSSCPDDDTFETIVDEEGNETVNKISTVTAIKVLE